MTDTLSRARAALDDARQDPQGALVVAKRIIEVGANATAMATAHFAAGLAQRTLGDVAASTVHLEAADEYAGDDDELRGKVLRSLAFNYEQAGADAKADSTIALSLDLLSGEERNLSRLQQAFMLLMRGAHHQALPVLNDAVESFEASSDDEHLELTLFNRALIHLESGDYAASLADLERAYSIGVRLGNQVAAAESALHMSQVLGWQDDIPGAMRWHSRSAEHRAAAGVTNPAAEAEYAFVLIQARLMQEAEEVLRASVPKVVAAGNREREVQVRLSLAQVLLARGEHAEAGSQVAAARQASPADGRFVLDIAATDHQVRMAAGDLSAALLLSMTQTADAMAANGERHAAAVERLHAVDVALAVDDFAAAATLCQNATRVARTAPLWLQIQAWSALAKVRLALGNRRGTAAAVRAGIRRLDEYRAGIGATDLRLQASDHGAELARIGLELALESGSVDRVFESAERLRTASYRASAAPVQHPELRDALTQLRRVTAQLQGASEQDSAKLRRVAARLERSVRDLARQVSGKSERSEIVRLDEVQRRLGGRVLVEYVAADGVLHAIVATPDSRRLVTLGSVPDIAESTDHLRLAAGRIARPGTSSRSQQAARESVKSSASVLHSRLLEPLATAIGPRRPVIIPTAGLHGIPWTLVADRDVEVAPAASIWLDALNRPEQTGSGVVAWGPGLEHAETEAATIAAITGSSIVESTSAALEGLEAGGLVHFACHARLRLDSPMFSSLLLEDGELTLYDLESNASSPGTVVLAACEGAGAVIANADEVLGIAAAFLRLGAKRVIAPLFTVSDAATAEAMRSFHTALASGLDAADAIAAAARHDDPVTSFTGASFVCFGVA